MKAKTKQAVARPRAGRTYLSVELDPQLRNALHVAARSEGKTITEWFPEFLRRHLPKFEAVSHT